MDELVPSVQDAIKPYTLTEVAALTGFSRRQLYYHARLGDLPFPVLNVGNRYRVPRVPFERWLATGTAEQVAS